MLSDFVMDVCICNTERQVGRWIENYIDTSQLGMENDYRNLSIRTIAIPPSEQQQKLAKTTGMSHQYINPKISKFRVEADTCFFSNVSFP